MCLYHRVMSPNDADGMANSVDPDQTDPLGAVWSGSALFAQAYLSENLGSLRYINPLPKWNNQIVSVSPYTSETTKFYPHCLPEQNAHAPCTSEITKFFPHPTTRHYPNLLAQLSVLLSQVIFALSNISVMGNIWWVVCSKMLFTRGDRKVRFFFWYRETYWL